MFHLICCVRCPCHFHLSKSLQFASVPQPVKLIPGDELLTTCVFDTSKRNRTTRGGIGEPSLQTSHKGFDCCVASSLVRPVAAFLQICLDSSCIMLVIPTRLHPCVPVLHICLGSRGNSLQMFCSSPRSQAVRMRCASPSLATIHASTTSNSASDHR